MTFGKQKTILICASVVRAFGIFCAYGTLTRYSAEPCHLVAVYSVVSFALESILSWRVHNGALADRWCKFSAAECVIAVVAQAVALTAIGKLHPFRFVIGEHLALVPLLVSQNLRLTLPCVLNAVVLLAWANNLSTTHDLGVNVNGEDLMHGIDSFTGTLLLLVFCGVECRRYSRAASPHSVGMRTAFISLLVSIVLAVFMEQVYGSATWSVGCILEGVYDALWLVVVPCLLERWSFCGNSFASLTALRLRHAVLGVAWSTLGGFVLHTLYHRHYKNGKEFVEERFHPVWHTDNIVVLLAAGTMIVAIFAGRLKNLNDSDDDGESIVTLADFLRNEPVQPMHRSCFTIISALLGNSRQRKLLIFLGCTLAFMLVELLYGIHANSLSLVSDSFHMLLDAASIALGLWTSVMATWPKTRKFPLGYHGFETLSGFANGLMLVIVAVMLLMESFKRLLRPEESDGEYLLAVAIGGLMVNIVGVAFFHDAHHGHSHCSHSHDCDVDGSHSHAHSHSATQDHNLRAVYLHILADLLGSVAVIISALVIRYTGWTLVDPICCTLLSSFILLSAWPLLADSVNHMTVIHPEANYHDARDALAKIEGVERVLTVDSWVQVGECSIVAVSVLCKADADRGVLRHQCQHVAEALLGGHRRSVTLELL